MPFEDPHPVPGRFAGLARAAVQDEVWLLGQPPLSDYLDFVRRSVADGEDMDPRALTDEWRVANDVYHELEAAEAGEADKARCRALPKAMRPLAEAMADHPYVRRSHDALPIRFGLVEIDRLVVSQPHVTLPFSQGLQADLSPGMDPAALFRFCFRTERRDPPVRVRRIDGRRWLLASDSTDFRFHNARLMPAAAVAAVESFGPVSAVLGVVAGFGSNLLTVIRSDKRMLLHNGYHRVHALRAAGIAFAPALIVEVTRRDELNLIASRTVTDEPAFFFASKRPPLVKDFFDARLAKVWPVKRMEKLIEISIEVQEHDVPLA